MKVVFAIKHVRNQDSTILLYRTINISTIIPLQLNLAALFRYFTINQKPTFFTKLNVKSTDKLKIKVFKISYWSVKGLATFQVPFRGPMDTLPKPEKFNKQYFIKYHIIARTYRRKTKLKQIANLPVYMLANRILIDFRKVRLN